VGDPGYDSNFYRELHAESSQSAEIVQAILRSYLEVRSVVDVGCGLGWWAAAFRDAGVVDHLGVDGDDVDEAELVIAPDRFVRHDLSTPFVYPRPFDLALCLEVAEHLDPVAAPVIVDSLVQLSDVVYFSAAIPQQGGTNHRNEQPLPYWLDQFRARGYVAVDCVRPHVWNDPRVAAWYSQNGIVYVREDRLERYPEIATVHQSALSSPLYVVHPNIFHWRIDQLAPPEKAPASRLKNVLARWARPTSR
jgi:SAM-dependent methyltransferase